MLSRLKRPGYWILLLLAISLYAYHRFQVEEKLREREARLNLYRSYGESVLSDLKGKQILALQERFEKEREKSIDLEKVALFIDTLQVDASGEVHWDRIQDEEENLTLLGRWTKEGNLSYPIDLFFVRRGKKVLLRKMKVGNYELAPQKESFPLNVDWEKNRSKLP